MICKRCGLSRNLDDLFGCYGHNILEPAVVVSYYWGYTSTDRRSYIVQDLLKGKSAFPANWRGLSSQDEKDVLSHGLQAKHVLKQLNWLQNNNYKMEGVTIKDSNGWFWFLPQGGVDWELISE